MCTCVSRYCEDGSFERRDSPCNFFSVKSRTVSHLVQNCRPSRTHHLVVTQRLVLLVPFVLFIVSRSHSTSVTPSIPFLHHLICVCVDFRLTQINTEV